MIAARVFVLLCMQLLHVLANPLKSQAPNTGSAKDYLITDLPGLHTNIPQEEVPLMFAGQLELHPENHTHYFFWKFSDRDKIPEANNRTVFWLNGGPGCSSMDGALMESGPFRINEDGQVTLNNGSWHKAGDMVFVDQPAGTGFSFADVYLHDLDQVAFDFLKFLQKYFELFPEDANNDIFFAGESYAGQYIPYIADRILKFNKQQEEQNQQKEQQQQQQQQNKKDQQPVTKYNLKGLLIGNGWVSPNEQSLSYLPYSVQAGIISPSNSMWSKLLVQHQACQKIVDQIDTFTDEQVHQEEVDSSVCEDILNMILSATRDKEHRSQECYNMYDYTLKDTYPSCGMSWPPDLAHVSPFLNKDAVKGDLNLIKPKTWRECSGRVGRHFSARNSLPAIHLFPSILAETKIMLFNGNRDIICNYMGTESMIKKLSWNGGTGFGGDEVSQAIDWIHNETTRGYIKTDRNLTFVNVFDSSHMVPFDLPEVSRALMDLITDNFDVVEENKHEDLSKRAFVTYPLGERQSKQKGIAASPSSSLPQATSSAPIASSELATSISSISFASVSATFGDKNSTDTNSHPEDSHTTSRITRLIQLLVIVIIIWGICVMYNSYRSRPSSIIKTRPSSGGRKKNVQWADQLRQFQEEDDFPLPDMKSQNQQSNQGFLSKAFSKLKSGNSDGRGAYAPAGTSDDIELGEAIAMTSHDDERSKVKDDNNNANGVDEFIIETDDEESPRVSHNDEDSRLEDESDERHASG